MASQIRRILAVAALSAAMAVSSVCSAQVALKWQYDPGESSAKRTIGEEIAALEREDSVVLRQRREVLLRLRDKIQPRLTDMARELREIAIRLHMDGMSPGTGRLSTKELELSELVRRQLELQSAAGQAQADYERMSQIIKEGKTPPKIDDYVRHDPNVAAYRHQIDAIDLEIASGDGLGDQNQKLAKLKQQRDMLRQKLEGMAAELRSNGSVSLMNELKESHDRNQHAVENLAKRIEADKEELGALNNLMSQWMARHDEAQLLGRRLSEIDQELDLIETVLAVREQPTTKPAR